MSGRHLFALAAQLCAMQMLHAQGILGTNLIVNGDAESGQAGTGSNVVASIPGWTRGAGNVNVLPYNLNGYLQLSDPAPQNRGFQYFIAGTTAALTMATITQTIDVSGAASTIVGGNVKYTASAYLGANPNNGGAQTAAMAVAFQNANGQTFSSITLTSDSYADGGLFMQEQIGLVPAGTTKVVVTLTFTGQKAEADNLSLVFTTLGTTPGSVLGTNLVANPGAELGPSAPRKAPTVYVPGWATSNGISVAPYGGPGWMAATDPGPVDRGTNLFYGAGTTGTMYQDLDVSPAASLIDAGQVSYALSAWLGGVSGTTSPTLTYEFFDWSGKQLVPTGQQGPLSHVGNALMLAAQSGTLPSGTRRVHISLSVPGSSLYAADDVGFTLAGPPGAPVISPGGIVSAGSFGGFTSIAPGSWIEIYGFDLAPATRNWTAADFMNVVAPTILGGVTVSIGGQAAYLDYVSTGQIDAQVPSNTPLGSVPVTISTANGTSDPFWLVVNPTQPGLLAPPNFVVDGKQYVAALFSSGRRLLCLRAPSRVPSRPASPGDVLTIYGVGFGPVDSGVPEAGTIVPTQNSLTTPVQFSFGSATAKVVYDGLAPSFIGLYQFNVVVPPAGLNSALPVTFSL